MSHLFVHAPLPEGARSFYAENAWQQQARELAQAWPRSALEREQANAKPEAELQSLRASGLLKLLIPTRLGGLGGELGDAVRVLVELARHDGSIAALLGFHYYASSVPRLSDFETDAEEIDRKTAQNNWFWGNVVQPFTPDFRATPDGEGGFVVHGFKKYNTGASYADITSVLARRTDKPEIVYAYIEPGRAGVQFHADWDHLGLRLSDTRSATFDQVRIRAQDIVPARGGVGRTNFPPLYLAYANTVYAALFVGSALGALEAARQYTLHSARVPPGLKHITDDPYVRKAYGELLVETQASEALLTQVAAEVAQAYAQRRSLDEYQIGQLSTRAIALRGHAANTALKVTAQAHALAGGVSAAQAARGLDRYWRDVRTLSLHDSLANAEGAIGLHFLSGKVFRLPEFFG